MKRQERESPMRSSRRSRNNYSGGHESRRESRSNKRSRDSKGHGHGDRYDIDGADQRSRRHRDDSFNRRDQRHGMSDGDSMNVGFTEYKTLCASNLNPSIPDDEIRDVLLHQFERFGNLRVKIMFSGDQRLAYLNYKTHAEAAGAKHEGKDMVLFDLKVHLDPVYGKSPGVSSRKRSLSPPPYSSRSNDRSFDSGRSNNFNRRRSDIEPFDHRNNMAFHSPPNMGSFDPHTGMPPNDFGLVRTKERFPHHLDHMNPEDDDRATRTLFVGNLDVSITEHGLRRIFETYGVVEEIDIKRPMKGQGNAYAFVKFFNLDMAHQAKVDMSGQFIGKFQCKIGYGKVAATTCLWVGGLEPWTTLDTIERVFHRFGDILRVFRPKGESFCYVLYEGIESATAACQKMRGKLLPRQDKRIKTDYADATHLDKTGPPRPFDCPNPMERPPSQGGFDNFGDGRGGRGPSDHMNRNGSNWNRSRDFAPQDQGFNRRDNNGRFEEGRDGNRDHQFNRSLDDDRNFSRNCSVGGDRPFNRGFSPSQDRNSDLDRYGNLRKMSPPPKRQRGSPFNSNNGGFSPQGVRNDNGGGMPSFGSSGLDSNSGVPQGLPKDTRDCNNAIDATSISDLTSKLPVAWSGALVLKNSAFAACMHLVSGDVSIVDSLMRDPTSTELPMLRITQRLRLDPSKLEEVTKQITTAGPNGYAVLLAVAGSARNVEESNSEYQQRPLKNLVFYLKQKEAAGVIVHGAASKYKENGVMHSFPPCEFGNSYLLKLAPKLNFSNTRGLSCCYCCDKCRSC